LADSTESPKLVIVSRHFLTGQRPKLQTQTRVKVYFALFVSAEKKGEKIQTRKMESWLENLQLGNKSSVQIRSRHARFKSIRVSFLCFRPRCIFWGVKKHCVNEVPSW
jgi:hypothetical protein